MTAGSEKSPAYVMYVVSGDNGKRGTKPARSHLQ
jgi:hypothetical protein